MKEQGSNVDQEETQPMTGTTPECTPSPEHVTPAMHESKLERGGATSRLEDRMVAMTDVEQDSDDDESENPEEEALTGDELVEPLNIEVLFQDNETLQILSDDEGSLMSPPKKMPAMLITIDTENQEMEQGGLTNNEAKAEEAKGEESKGDKPDKATAAPPAVTTPATPPAATAQVEKKAPQAEEVEKPSGAKEPPAQQDQAEKEEEAEVAQEAEEEMTSDLETSKDTNLVKNTFKEHWGSGMTGLYLVC